MFLGWSGIPGVLGYYARGGLVYGSSQDVPGMVRYPRCPRILCQGECSVYESSVPRMHAPAGIPVPSRYKTSQDVPGTLVLCDC